MKKKLLSTSLIVMLLITSLCGTPRTAQAALPDVAIKLAKPLLERLIVLIAAGLKVESITSAEDIAGRYYESGITAPSWDAEGNLTIDIPAIDNARNWLDAVYPGLPATIEVDGGLSYIGQTLPAFEDYTPESSPRTLFQNHDFSAPGRYQINILNFGSITTWMDYENGSSGGSYDFPPYPQSTSYPDYIVIGVTNLPEEYHNPYSLLYCYFNLNGYKLYRDGSNIKLAGGTESRFCYSYTLKEDQTWYRYKTAKTKIFTDSFDGIIYDASVPIYTDETLTTTIPIQSPPGSGTGESNDCVMTLSDGETGDQYDLDLSMYSAYASWGNPSGSTNVDYPYGEYLGLYNEMRWNISSRDSLNEPGKRDLIIWPSFHDLTYGWTDYDQMPNFTFEGTSGTNINLTIDASPMDTIQAQMQYFGSYPKTDLIIGDKATETVITGQPTNWNQINNIVENPVDPSEEPPEEEEPPSEELGLLSGILALFNTLFNWLQSLPNLITEAMGTKLIALLVPLDLTPIQNDFNEVNDAFADAFPFSIAADLHGLFFPPDGGLQYPCIGYTMVDPDQVERYHVVFDFGDIPSGHRAMSDKLRHILTLGLWLAFAVGVLTLALKRGGKIS